MKDTPFLCWTKYFLLWFKCALLPQNFMGIYWVMFGYNYPQYF